MLYKACGLRVIVCDCSSWEIVLNVALEVSFNNMKDWRRMWKKAGKLYMKYTYTFFFNYWGGTLGTAVTYWPIVLAPDDR
jgi:hypothetical protein